MLKAPLGLYMHLVLDKNTEPQMVSQETSTKLAAGSAGARVGIRERPCSDALGVIQGSFLCSRTGSADGRSTAGIGESPAGGHVPADVVAKTRRYCGLLPQLPTRAVMGAKLRFRPLLKKGVSALEAR
jgi:hypothetical protein